MQADIVLFPFIDRFALCAPRHAGYDVRGACGGAIGKWLDAMSARQSCMVSCANSDAPAAGIQVHTSPLASVLRKAPET